MVVLHCFFISLHCSLAYSYFPASNLRPLTQLRHHQKTTHQFQCQQRHSITSSLSLSLLPSPSPSTIIRRGEDDLCHSRQRRRNSLLLAATPVDDDGGPESPSSDGNDKKKTKRRLWTFKRSRKGKRNKKGRKKKNQDDESTKEGEEEEQDPSEEEETNTRTDQSTTTSSDDDTSIDAKDSNESEDTTITPSSSSETYISDVKKYKKDGDDSTPPSSLNELMDAANLIGEIMNEKYDDNDDDDDDDALSRAKLDSTSNKDELPLEIPTDDDNDNDSVSEAPTANESSSKIIESADVKTKTKPKRRLWIFGSRKGGNEKIIGSNTTESTIISKNPANDGVKKNSAPSQSGIIEETSTKVTTNSEPKKKKSSALTKTLRTLTVVLAILCYPIVADEVGDYVAVGSGSLAQRRSTPEEQPLPDSENSEPKATTEKNPKGETTKDDGSEGSIVDSKDRLPPAPKQRGNIGNQNKPALNDRRRMALSFISEVVDEVGPAVVRIDTESMGKNSNRGNNNNGQNNNPLYVQQGQGSGLIFSSEGYILTNAHVVEGATKVKGKQ